MVFVFYLEQYVKRKRGADNKAKEILGNQGAKGVNQSGVVN